LDFGFRIFALPTVKLLFKMNWGGSIKKAAQTGGRLTQHEFLFAIETAAALSPGASRAGESILPRLQDVIAGQLNALA
jgi:hypothetical protein